MLKIKDWLNRPAFDILTRTESGLPWSVLRLKDGKIFSRYVNTYPYNNKKCAIQSFDCNMFNVEIRMLNIEIFNRKKAHIDELDVQYDL